MKERHATELRDRWSTLDLILNS